MGANAVTTVPVYVAGEVLTAADLNITNSGIPVFASSVERDAAFGGTGEKTLAEGQFAYLEGTNTTQYYDGAAWQAVGVSPGLVCVKAQTAFTTVANFTADSVFTSSYTNYLLLLEFTSSSSSATTNVQFRASCSTISSTDYAFNTQSIVNSMSINRQDTQSSLRIIETEGQTKSSGALTIYGPQVSDQTRTTYIGAEGGGSVAQYGVGAFRLTTAFDGIQVNISTGTFTGTYAIYGYSKTV